MTAAFYFASGAVATLGLFVTLDAHDGIRGLALAGVAACCWGAGWLHEMLEAR